jgi:hypothetical protein
MRRRRLARDPRSKAEIAHEARRHAERVELQHGPGNRRTIDAYEVAADAYEDDGATGAAHAIRMQHVAVYTGKGYGYGISPPHGIFTKGATMAYIKTMVKRSGSHFFDRGNVRFFGREKTYGPYIGPGGVYFVTVNKAGTSIRPVSIDWSVGVPVKHQSVVTIDDARRYARQLAQGRR